MLPPSMKEEKGVSFHIHEMTEQEKSQSVLIKTTVERDAANYCRNIHDNQEFQN